jgi:hypothetical protein
MRSGSGRHAEPAFRRILNECLQAVADSDQITVAPKILPLTFSGLLKNHWFTRRLATLWFTFAIIILSLAAREYYPLSRFPMYAHFDSESHYLFMTDENGEPVTDMRHQFMQTAIRLHKMHSTKVDELRNQPGGRERDKLDMMREAGWPMLEQMISFQEQRWAKRKNHSDKREFQRLDLWVVFLRYQDESDPEGNRLIREKHHLATWPKELAGTAPPASAKAEEGGTQP